MEPKDFATSVLMALPFDANEQQMRLVYALAKFCCPLPENEGRVFMLNGYAGTGKTSVTGALVKALHSAGMDSVLLAPTGRAAKVFGNFAGRPAYTIHRRIYRHAIVGTASYSSPGIQANNARNTIFIVDEASMIGAADDRGTNLLADLIQYVYTGQNCRLILMGDTAQLPPVGSSESPAMNPDVIRGFGLKVSRVTLTDVVRQSAQSGILRNATRLRRAMNAKLPAGTVVPIDVASAPDVEIVTPEEMADLVDGAYAADGLNETTIITRSNRTAVEFNKAVRSVVLGREEELAKSELLIVAKNNYHWTRKVKDVDFLANGEVVSIEAIHGTEVKYGCRFADVALRIADAPEDATVFDAKIILDVLHCDTAGLSQEKSNRLYEGIMTDNSLFDPSTPYEARVRTLRDNPYWNALQVKYAYAVTCHKAQGGQWKNVFIDLSYIPADSIGADFYRWLYTAVTRARSRLFLISPPQALVV